MGMVIKTKTGKLGYVVKQQGLKYLCNEIDANNFLVTDTANKVRTFLVSAINTEKVKDLEPWELRSIHYHTD